MSHVGMAGAVVMLLTVFAACDADGTGWGFRNLGKRDASELRTERPAAR